MKKIIIVLFIFATLLSPFSISAATQDELKEQLIVLLTQLITQLQQQIADLLAQQSVEPTIADTQPIIQQQTETTQTNLQTVTQIQSINNQINNPPVCKSNWQCSEWGECIDFSQSRTCTDLNKCATPTDKPMMQKQQTALNIPICISEDPLTISFSDKPTIKPYEIYTGKYSLITGNNSYTIESLTFSFPEQAVEIIDSDSRYYKYGDIKLMFRDGGATIPIEYIGNQYVVSFTGLAIHIPAESSDNYFYLNYRLKNIPFSNVDVSPTITYVKALNSWGDVFDNNGDKIIIGNTVNKIVTLP